MLGRWLSGIVCILLFLIIDEFMWLRSHAIVCLSRILIEYFHLIWFERLVMFFFFFVFFLSFLNK